VKALEREVNDEVRERVRKREQKAIEKIIYVRRMDEKVFERTIDEVKYRYYEVARALLKHRGIRDHPYLKLEPFDIEYEVMRRCNWERIFARGKESH